MLHMTAESPGVPQDSTSGTWTELVGVTVPEAARLLSITEKAAYAQVGRKQIPTFSIGGRQLVPVAWLIEKRNTKAA